MSRYTDDAYMANVRRACELFASMRTSDGRIDHAIAKRSMPEISSLVYAMANDKRLIRPTDLAEVEAARKIARIVHASAKADAAWYREIVAAQPGSDSS
jgi:hypothetical protein